MSARLLVARCPAKVNLRLRVGEPDATGYHPVETTLQAVGLCDWLRVELGGQDVTSDWTALPEDNTLSRVLRYVAETVDVPPIGVRLTKCIPPQSGLGGGSSDAAGLIRCLGALLGDAFPDSVRADVAAAIGVDVPFFLVGGLASAEHYGERVHPLPDPPRRWLTIVQPDVGVSSAEAYARLDAARAPVEGENDFLAVAPPECAELVLRLRACGAELASLSGSGSAVFGVFADAETAARARATVCGETKLRGWIAPTLDRAESLWMWSS